MKNLKKVLALATAFACASTMFASAAYTDQADIKAQSAVEMLSALGIIKGNPDGKFNPDGTVTRAEMAKMIYTVRNGGNDNADAYASLTSKFTDVYNGFWAAGYIKYCESLGIISGKSATKFDPNGTVTGLETAKMLLVMAGYTPEKAGLVGAGWDQKTLALASENELLNGIEVSMSSGLPRQYAAQMLYNALDMDTVVYSKDIEGFKPAEDVTDKGTIAAKYMGLVKEDAGILKSVVKTDGRDTYTIKTDYTDSAGKTSEREYSKVPSDISNLTGQSIKVLRKVKNSDAKEVYGVYANEDSKVLASGYAGELETDGNDRIKMAGNSYRMDSKVVGYTNVYGKVKDTTLVGIAQNANPENEKDTLTTNLAATQIKLIDNNSDGKVDTYTMLPVTVGTVTSVAKSTATIGNGGGTVRFDEDTVYDGIAKGDVVTVIDSKYLPSGGKLVEKLDTVSVKIEGVRGKKIGGVDRNTAVKIDGVWYNLPKELNKGNTFQTGRSYDVVIVGNTVVASSDVSSTLGEVGFITEIEDAKEAFGTNKYSQKAYLFTPDGNGSVIEVTQKFDESKNRSEDLSMTNNLGAATKEHNELYTYTKLSDGTYRVRAITENAKAGGDKFIHNSENAYKDKKLKDSAGNEYSIADDAVVYVRTPKESKVLSGKQVKDWNKDDIKDVQFTADFLTSTVSGIEYAKVAALVTANDIKVPGASSTSTGYAYLVSNPYLAQVDGENKTAYDVWTGTESKTLYGDGKEVSAGDLITYKVKGKLVEDVTNTAFAAAVLGFDGKAEGELRVVAQGATEAKVYTLDKDCVILGVDDANNKGITATLENISLANFDTKEPTKRLANVRIQLDDKGSKVKAIVVDIENNKLRGDIKVTDPDKQ